MLILHWFQWLLCTVFIMHWLPASWENIALKMHFQISCSSTVPPECIGFDANHIQPLDGDNNEMQWDYSPHQVAKCSLESIPCYKAFKGGSHYILISVSTETELQRTLRP